MFSNIIPNMLTIIDGINNHNHLMSSSPLASRTGIMYATSIAININILIRFISFPLNIINNRQNYNWEHKQKCATQTY